MANITDQFVTSFSELYYSTTPIESRHDTPTPAEIRLWFSEEGPGELVPLVMEIGSLSDEAVIIDTPTFGEVYKGKVHDQVDAQLYWAPRHEVHKHLKELKESGQQIYVGIKWDAKPYDSNNDKSEYVYFDSFVSSFGIDTTFDDVAKVSSTLVVDGAEHFAEDP